MPRRPTALTRAGAAVLLGLALLASAAGCSKTGLSGTVKETTTTTTPTTAAPSDPNSSGGSGGSGGSGSSSSSPAGLIVYVHPDTPTTLWQVHADGSERKALPAVANKALTAPALSTDATQLAFLAAPLGPDGKTVVGGANAAVWVAKADGSAAHALTDGSDPTPCISWVPNTQQLLIAFTAAGAPHATVHLVNTADPSAPVGTVSLPIPPGSCPAFVSSSTLIWAEAGPSVDPNPPRDHLMSGHTDGTTGGQLAALPGCSIDQVRPAPDSSTVAFTATCPTAGRNGLYVVDQKGQPQLQVPDVKGAFAWSPDAAWIAYVRRDTAAPDTTAEILIARPDGSAARRLVGPVNLDPTWSQPPGGGGGESPA